MCIDVVPFGESGYVARPYGFNDTFKGALAKEETYYQGMSVGEWCAVRGISVEEIENGHDLQAARLFPVCSSVEELGAVMRWMVSEPALQQGKKYGNAVVSYLPMIYLLILIFIVWQNSVKLSG